MVCDNFLYAETEDQRAKWVTLLSANLEEDGKLVVEEIERGLIELVKERIDRGNFIASFEEQ